MTFGCYLTYLTLSLLLTVWLGSTLHREGRLFLIDCLNGSERQADAVNHLLLTGFYLINGAWITLTLKSNVSPATLTEAVEFVSHRIGVVGLLLGGMHAMNLILFLQVRNHRMAVTAARRQ